MRSRNHTRVHPRTHAHTHAHTHARTQAEPRAALSMAAFGANPLLKIQRDDLVLYSAKVIPGNEGRVMRMMNSLAGWGCGIAMGRQDALHTSGHAYQEEQKEVIKMVNPQNFLPVHGEYAFLQVGGDGRLSSFPFPCPFSLVSEFTR